MENQAGILFIVATPIGDPGDITLRAIETLRQADAIICEEVREGSTLLKKIGIAGKTLITLNEHNESEKISEIIIRLGKGESLALISDCGTPVFADPGARLIAQVVDFGFKVSPIPGTSSLMAALSILNEKIDQFIFGGFLPRDETARESELRRLRGLKMPLILMDTPYRMGRLLDEIAQVFGKQAQVTLACDLTLPSETILRGPVNEIRRRTQNRKAEFILIIHASRNKPTS